MSSRTENENKVSHSAVTRPNVTEKLVAELRRELDEVKRSVREVSAKFEKLDDAAKDATAR